MGTKSWVVRGKVHLVLRVLRVLMSREVVPRVLMPGILVPEVFVSEVLLSKLLASEVPVLVVLVPSSAWEYTCDHLKSWN